MNTSDTKSIEDLTAEELEQLLAKKKAAKKAAEEKARKAYEAKRDKTVGELVTKALELEQQLEQFKHMCHISMEEHAVELQNYGKLRSNSKGGFSLTDSTGTLRITRRRDTEPNWDERSTKAVTLIKDFLGDTIKKRDLDLYEILMSFLEKNQNGDLEYGRVMNLWQHEDKYNDPRWKEGLRLIKESFNNHLKGYGYEFKTRATDTKWQSINLTFASA
ncbi:DUF3164 family protein [Zobellia galactanivorans]|uniref:DUF3164 family protein n=1 Tax=Zobellia galactanivorans (strain DSM 12802 / CCUG 47099 / CIP 106680 / NCIMB 13871 / Dsij) TaxID=63186 RepID=UPI0026E149F5|nr:DUF3164 family protein [Zobellia galactanivorans]MDO6808114.1 DUF3164 family protein [Zobellia galactanivorans]